VRLQRFDAAADFHAQAEAFLARREAEHNLLLGICAGLIAHPERTERPPYLATVDHEGEVVVAAVMTPPRAPVLSLLAAPEALALLAADLYAFDPARPGVLGPASVSLAFAAEWQRLSGRSYHKRFAQRIYQLEAVMPVTGVPGRLRRAEQADRDLVTRWILAFSAEAMGESDPRGAERAVDSRLDSATAGLYLWENGNGGPVSLAGYSGPTPRGIRVGPVYTPPASRGHGYASACVAALSQLLLDGGRRYCFLFTDLANPTSNRIYQQIGYRPVCDVDEYRFTF